MQFFVVEQKGNTHVGEEGGDDGEDEEEDDGEDDDDDDDDVGGTNLASLDSK